MCAQIRAVTRQIQQRASELRATGTKACVVIASDGEATDGDIAAALRPLRDLPAWVVVRLCTDDDKVVQYWNEIDEDLELDMDVLDDLELLDESLPRDDAAFRTDRILIGLRRWTWTPLPSLAPAVSQRFTDRLDFTRAALASANAPPIASLRPAIRYAGAWCADGVNAFSLWCAVPYMCAVMRGAAVAAPRETVNGAAALPWNHIYAAWNWPVLDHVLSMTRGRRYFVTPTAGGHVDLSRLLLVSRRWVATLWADGYRHAAALDAGGYFEGLAPRRAV